MKFQLIFIFGFLLIFNFNYSQELTVLQSIVVNSVILEKYDTAQTIINLKIQEKKALNSLILNHLKKDKKLFYGSVFDKYYFDENGNIDSSGNSYYYFIKANNKVFIKDSVQFLFQVPKLDEKGVKMYDNEGDEIYIAQNYYRPFSNSLYKLNTKESWNYNNGKLTKSNLAVGLGFKTTKIEFNEPKYTSYFSNSLDSVGLVLFKENVIYTHCFYPEYYSIFLNNDSIKNFPFADKIELGFKNSENNSSSEIYNFLKPLLKDLYFDTLSIYKLDSNNKFLQKVKADQIKELFQNETIHSLSEDGETMYDDEGDEMYITTRECFQPDAILGIEFYEDWYLGKGNFQIKKKVKGIVLVIGDYDEKGVLRGLKKIPAYVSFED